VNEKFHEWGPGHVAGPDEDETVVAQNATQRGYYMPSRNSTHCSRHQYPYWRRREQDFGGVVEA
jgi:hypothetical protein